MVAIALISARVFGYLFIRIKQPAVIGEILAGIVLGGLGLYIVYGQKIIFFNHAFIIPDLDYHSIEFDFLAEIGILFLLFISGLEISISKFKKMGKASLYVAIGGVLFPFILGIISILLLNYTQKYDFTLNESIIIGLILVATSVGVTVRSLMDINALDTDVGATILGSAVIDDIIGILLLAFAIGIGSLMDAVWIGIRIALFFIVFLYIGLKVIDKILDLGEKIDLPKAFLSITISILLIYAFFADRAGISGIIGAFIAGVLIGQNFRSVKIDEDIRAIGYGFFIPIFFIWVGSSLWLNADDDFSSLAVIGLLAFVVVIVSIIGKILGCGLGARLAGLTGRESLQIGVGMIPRMELALIIVSASIKNNLLQGEIAHQILFTTVIMTIVTTILAPFLIKITFKNDK